MVSSVHKAFNSCHQRLVTDSVRNCATGQQLYGLQRYYGQELKRVTVVQQQEAQKKTVERVDVDGERADRPETAQFTLLERMGAQFDRTIAMIREEPEIGLEVKGVGVGRNCQLCMVQLSCRKGVFLFDVVRLGVDCIERGLAEVFQSSQITKVLHDCRRTSHILFHQFCITLSNIFDTQVTDLFIRKNETSEMPSHVRSLPDCLADYLGLAEDETCLVSKGHSMVEPGVWLERPFPTALLCSAAKYVEYLSPLAEVMRERYMQILRRGFEVYLTVGRSTANPEMIRQRKNDQIIPELSNILDSQRSLLCSQTVTCQNKSCSPALLQNKDQVEADTQTATNETKTDVTLRKEHEEKWIQQTREFMTSSMSKRRETLHRQLDELLTGHAEERRRDKKRKTEIDSQRNGHDNTPDDDMKIDEIDRPRDHSLMGIGIPAFRLDPWSVNPQFDKLVCRPIPLNDPYAWIYEDRLNEEEEAGSGTTVGLRWPTDKQINRMMRQDGHQP
jgi:hypothetical protein